ncbi:hypothetical protein ACFL21_01760 [Patescibacteria group bacterium]
MSTLIRAIAYVCIGVTLEVVYTGIKSFIVKKDKRLLGFTQVWVMPIYALGAIFIFEPLHHQISDIHIIFRFLIYALIIFVLEYIFGLIFKLITGKCPWEYKGKWNIHGFINLPHFPFWGILGLLFEILHNYFIAL